MTETGLSAADIAAVTDRNCGYGYGDGMFGGNGGFFWIFALLLLPMLNGGGFWGNNRGNAVTEADLCQSQSFAELKGSVGRLNDQVAAVNTNLGNAVCNLGYETLRNFNNLEQILSQCCCNIEKEILESRYQAAQNTSAILQGQKDSTREIIDWLCGQENRNLRDENMRNYIQSQFCGVPRFQPGTVYGAVPANPFFGNWNNCGFGCGNGCCGNGNI